MSQTPGVWNVQQEDFPHHTVVRVFATLVEADSFAERMKGRFEDGLFQGRHEIGYRSETGNSGYSSGG